MRPRRPTDARSTASLKRRGWSATGDHVLVARSGDQLELMPLDGDTVVIGRGSECDAVIDDDSISRTHARVHFGDAITVEDLGSRNGTKVRGERLAPKQRIAISLGEPFAIADVVVFVERRKSTPRVTERDGVIIRDPKLVQLYAVVDIVARSDLRVLLLGETGVGKDVIARAIHTKSLRAAKPYVALNCGALPETLLEAELFGYEKGAFTGANTAKPGLFESAHGGTVLLDEVGELSPATQVKLLRVLEAGEIMRLGSVTPKRIDVRVVAATNRDLRAMVGAGTFRQDLYYRLDGTTLKVPPLRERIADIAPLARMFCETIAAGLGKPAPVLAPETIARLETYAWPGNVRELRNVIERAVVMCEGPLKPQDLELAGAFVEPKGTLWSEVEAVERQRILDALADAGGNQTAAAKSLGIARTTLIRRIEHFGLARPKKRE